MNMRTAQILVLLNSWDLIPPEASALDGLDIFTELVATLTPRDDCELVVFHWSTEHGACYDCGLPAAFYRTMRDLRVEPLPEDLLCAICAANAAAGGDEIMRIDDES